jgi:fructosamine-3-kinase
VSVALPVEVRAGVEAALSSRIRRVSPVGGGCISPVARVEMEGGGVAFVKWREPGGVRGLFRAEATSLAALAAAAALRVPAVLGVEDAGEGVGWLLLEWLEPGRPGTGSWERLGHGLARLHRTVGPRWGWPEDNFIGPLPQANGWLDDWPAFWRERRLEPQLRRAVEAGALSGSDRRRFDRLLDRLDEALAGAAADGPSLLHGDLWSGNVHFVAGGEPALIDPSSSYGHREVDLAMAELFGGFDAAFFRAYDEAWPVDAAYRAVRRPVYQLYYLLVHVNLFGAGYVARTQRALAEAGV